MSARAAFFLLCIGCGGQLFGQLRLDNTTDYVGDGLFRWTVFLTGPDAELNRVRYVEYTLDPAFPNPVRRTEDRQRRFAISDRSRLSFTIYARVVLADGGQVKQEYRLRPTRGERNRILLGTRSQYRDDGSWEWSVFLTGGAAALETVDCVAYRTPSAQRTPTRVCSSGPDAAMPFELRLHEQTPFRVSAEVRFYDATVKRLEANLVAVRLTDAGFGSCSFFVVENVGETAVSLHKWKVSDGDHFEYTFLHSDQAILLQGYDKLEVRFSRGCPTTSVAEMFGGVAALIVSQTPGLGDTRRPLRLIDQNGRIVQEYRKR